MPSLFENKTVGPYLLTQCRAWDALGLVHGFIGKPYNFSDRYFPSEIDSFRQAFKVDRVILLEQIHSASIKTPDMGDFSGTKTGLFYLGKADGIVVMQGFDNKTAFAVRAADCVSIIAKCGEAIAIVHAGWKGISLGICEKAFSILQKFGPRQIEAIIGPCAGKELYEVGEEVIAAIGESAAYEKIKPRLYKLDLIQSIKNQIRSSFEVAWADTGVCTIKSTFWHSHRREGEAAGRNLSFFIA